MRNDSRFLPLLRRALLPLVILGAAACAGDSPLQPGDDDGLGSHPAPENHVLGLMEITISGIGTSSMSASALPVRPGVPHASGANFALAPVEEGGKKGIQLEPYSSGSFTHGTRGNGGVRYVYATYRVRNASADSTPYSTPRKNLTFIAAGTSKTLGETAVSQLRRFDGTPAADAIAPQVIPTGAVEQSLDAEIVPKGPDVLQVFEESELAGIAVAQGVELFPYGFVVRNTTSTTTRALPASPAANQFDGLVTFAFKIPLQATPAEDPFTVSAIFQAVDDSETRITQSLEEQTPAGEAAFLARAEALGASMKTVLPGMGSYWGEPNSTRTVCMVRTAGPSGTPAGYLVQVPVANVSFASTDLFATWPLLAGGSVARALDAAAWDGSGTRLPDVPAHLSIGQPGVLTAWGRRGVRMLPRRDRANALVSATACGHATSMQVPASGYTPISAGALHSLALRADGTVVAWGGNDSGQANVPPEFTNLVQVAAGNNHSLALRADGTVVAWGSNSWGQTNVPPGLTEVVQIAAGGSHSLALRADGTLVGWGNNAYHQTSTPAGLTEVVQIAAGTYHSLALRADGTVVAWGDNNHGQATVPVGLTDVVQVAARLDHSLALRADGTVVAWGGNDSGQANVPPGLTAVVQIAAGTYHSLALRADGTVAAWGNNGQGQTNVPAGLTEVVQVSAGFGHSLALKADGTVVAWGGNTRGQSSVPDSLVAAVP